ncbi:MAG: phenylalanine--tRNA ligase subunit beta [Actinomycetota bacterium]|nr:phenylalanine--tRNA ligase subunit beta [Actinomycetota bacterium]
MRAPVSWLREFVDIPADQSGRAIAERLINAGLEVETVDVVGLGVDGPVVVGQVVSIDELTEFKKPIHWCLVDVGTANGAVRGIICGARNFDVGDHVVVALPGTVLPGGFAIAQRETYGKVSDGMICSARELGLGDDHDGIIILEASTEVGADAKPIVGVGEEILDIAVTPDRGYALSIRGLARELAIAYDLEFADPGLALAELPAPVASGRPVDCGSDDEAACGLFTLRTIDGFNPKASAPVWMQRRLIDCGMRPVSLAVDVTNYVMLELGQPLHAFDANKLQGTVRAGHVPAGTALETLDHVERILAADDLVILDDRGVIGLAGTMGGFATEIDETTTTIALEAAHFSAGEIARMARRHKLSSEASRRFERGVDRVLAPYASARAAALLIEFGGGTYFGMTAVEAPYEPTVVEMHSNEPAQVAGMPISIGTVVSLLSAVGCEVTASGETLFVRVPSWRADITDPANLVEEVIRLIGFDAVPSTLPKAAVGHGLSKAQRLRRRVGLALAARGGLEVLNYPFVGEAELSAFRFAADDVRASQVRLANPMSEEQPFLRASLLPGLAAAAKRNLSRGFDDLFLFELGAVVRGRVGVQASRPNVMQRPDDEQWQALNAMLPAQVTAIAALLVGHERSKSWSSSERAFEWSDAIANAHAVVDALGLTLTVERGSDVSFHPGRCAQLKSGDAVIGVAGELHPRVLEDLGLPPRTCALEIDFDLLVAAAPDARPAPGVSAQPVAKEDLALVVREEVSAAQIEQAIHDGAGQLLESVRLFDVYRGQQVPEGSRSLAFALRFRAEDRTLEAAEIAQARQAAIDLAAERHGATLR